MDNDSEKSYYNTAKLYQAENKFLREVIKTDDRQKEEMREILSEILQHPDIHTLTVDDFEKLLEPMDLDNPPQASVEKYDFCIKEYSFKKNGYEIFDTLFELGFKVKFRMVNLKEYVRLSTGTDTTFGARITDEQKEEFLQDLKNNDIEKLNYWVEQVAGAKYLLKD